ncbi:LysE family translocator [Thiosocius teredinicola]|uniref:LysE family translocator n=1 Tax=Thiosocius teredinicola TaxID=1973002 RepID=UPI0009914A47
MTAVEFVSLFSIIAVLAAMPSASVLLVVTRTAMLGVVDGVAVAAGIVVGDLVLVCISLAGLAAVAHLVGDLFGLIRILCGIYLVWYGYKLLKAGSAHHVAPADGSSSAWGGFIAGLTLTLGDVKAIVFYASLFPAFVDVQNLARVDVGVIGIATLATVGLVKLGYVYLAHRIRRRLHSGHHLRKAEWLAGGLLVGTGVYIVAKP